MDARKKVLKKHQTIIIYLNEIQFEFQNWKTNKFTFCLIISQNHPIRKLLITLTLKTQLIR